MITDSTLADTLMDLTAVRLYRIDFDKDTLMRGKY